MGFLLECMRWYWGRRVKEGQKHRSTWNSQLHITDPGQHWEIIWV